LIALYNPLLDDSDTKIIRDLTRIPKEVIPPLVELSARTIVKHNLQWKPGDLPKRLEGERKHLDIFEIIFFLIQRCYYTAERGVVNVVGQYSITIGQKSPSAVSEYFVFPCIQSPVHCNANHNT